MIEHMPLSVAAILVRQVGILSVDRRPLPTWTDIGYLTI